MSMMKKKLTIFASTCLLSGFLVACSDGEEQEPEQPIAPDVPEEQAPQDGNETDPGTEPGGESGTEPGTEPGGESETEPGTEPGGESGTEPGTDPSTDSETETDEGL